MLKTTFSFPVDSRDFAVVKSLFQSVLTITRNASGTLQEATFESLRQTVRRNKECDLTSIVLLPPSRNSDGAHLVDAGLGKQGKRFWEAL